MKSESEDKYSVTIFKLTSGGFKNGDLSFFQTGIQGAHKLELNAVRRIRMMKVLCRQLHDAWVNCTEVISHTFFSYYLWMSAEQGRTGVRS